MSFTAEFIAEQRWNPNRPATSCQGWREVLGQLLVRAARGDAGAFMEFYDLTSGPVYRAMLQRYDAAETAEAATQALYSRAWDEADQHAASGLSPLAWLLSGLPAPLPTAC